ncbi:MAG TPA: DUF4262 domain-containing protein [Kofleriaceae bacterium]|nr:DUF4262 domain-containing protein [Kofleriaceae bacterium]
MSADDPGHGHGGRFEFRLDPDTAVYVCRHVRDGAPVLYATLDEDHDWQFLCGADHGDHERPLLACLGCVVAADPTLNDVAAMTCEEWAERDAVGEPWTRHDPAMDRVREGVAEHGWWVMKVPAGESADEPAFAYTIGLWSSYQHAELIVIGLPLEVAHVVLNDLGGRIRDGRPVPVGADLAEVIQGYPVRLREVVDPQSHRAHVGRALAYHRAPFPLLQLVWPDKQGRFPGHPDAPAWMAARQPLLP